MKESKNSFTPEKKLETIEKIIGLVEREYEETIKEFKTINCTGLLMRCILYDAIKIVNERFTENKIIKKTMEGSLRKQIQDGGEKMNNLMIFEDKQVEVFEWNGKALFNPKHVAECLDISDVNSSIRNFNDKQVIKLTNSNMHNMQFRKLHNTGENFLTESGVYKLIFKSKKEEAEKFQDWVTDKVLPSIRKTGSYQTNNNKSINEFKGQITTFITDLFQEKLSEVEQYYKIKSQSKTDISTYIKKRLGILRADDEYEQVKARVFLLLGINKWEDLDVESYKTIIPVVDESIRIIKLDRPIQVSMFE